jgi:hypothetical protein
MSVNSYLTNLASDLVLSELEKLSIITSINTLSTRLNLHFGYNVTEKFQFGSSTRNTILPRKADDNSDIDYMVVFNTSEGQKKPHTYLDYLRNFVEKKYSTSEIYQSHPTIVLSLNHINFELVPAIYNYGYHIPSPSSYWSEWTITNPSKTNQLIQDKNKNNNSLIKPLVRLVKYWNKYNGSPFSSFLIEEYIVSLSFWGCSNLKDYFYDFWGKFNCSYNIAQSIRYKMNRTKEHVIKARHYESINLLHHAELEIRKILPSL